MRPCRHIHPKIDVLDLFRTSLAPLRVTRRGVGIIHANNGQGEMIVHS